MNGAAEKREAVITGRGVLAGFVLAGLVYVVLGVPAVLVHRALGWWGVLLLTALVLVLFVLVCAALDFRRARRAAHRRSRRRPRFRRLLPHHRHVHIDLRDQAPPVASVPSRLVGGP